MTKFTKSQRKQAIQAILMVMDVYQIDFLDIQGQLDAKIFMDSLKDSPEEEEWLKTQKLGAEGRKPYDKK